MLRGKGREKQLVVNTMSKEIAVIRYTLSFPRLENTNHEEEPSFLTWVLSFNDESCSCLNF